MCGVAYGSVQSGVQTGTTTSTRTDGACCPAVMRLAGTAWLFHSLGYTMGGTDTCKPAAHIPRKHTAVQRQTRSTPSSLPHGSPTHHVVQAVEVLVQHGSRGVLENRDEALTHIGRERLDHHQLPGAGSARGPVQQHTTGLGRHRAVRDADASSCGGSALRPCMGSAFPGGSPEWARVVAESGGGGVDCGQEAGLDLDVRHVVPGVREAPPAG